MVDTVELLILIAILFGAQKYLSSLESGWLGLITPMIFSLYMFIKYFYFNQYVEYFWFKLLIGNFILISDYYLGQEKKKERHKRELEKMKTRDL